MSTLSRLSASTASVVLRQRARTCIAFEVFKGWQGTKSAPGLITQHDFADVELVKAAVGAVTSDALKAAQTLADAFVSALEPKDGLAAMAGRFRSVPANVRIPGIVTSTSAVWHAEGKPDPFTQFAARTNVLGTHSLKVPIGVSKELLKMNPVTAIAIAHTDMNQALTRAINSTLFDNQAAVPAQRPAGVCDGVPATGGGSPVSDPAGLELDVRQLLATVKAAAPFFACGEASASFLGTIRISGQRVFPDVTITPGGSILGVPVIIATGLTGRLVLVDADALLVADSGVEFESSDVASFEQVLPPLSDPTVGTGQPLVSGWQTGVMTLRAVRFLDWSLGRPTASGFVNLPM